MLLIDCSSRFSKAGVPLPKTEVFVCFLSLNDSLLNSQHRAECFIPASNSNTRLIPWHLYLNIWYLTLNACKIQFFFFLFTLPLAVGFPHHRRLQHHLSTAHHPRSDPWLYFFKSTSNCWGNLLGSLAPIQRILEVYLCFFFLELLWELAAVCQQEPEWLVFNTVGHFFSEPSDHSFLSRRNHVSRVPSVRFQLLPLVPPLVSPSVPPANSSPAIFLSNCSSVCLPYTVEFQSDPFNEAHFPKVFLANPHIFFKSFSRLFSF